MNTTQRKDFEWHEYYDQFPYFSSNLIRKGCHPRIMEHEKPPQKAIILVHGLSDSPGLLTAIADYFFSTLGYNVYLPLLHFHGLKNPKGMEGVELKEWKSNVEFAIQTAATQVDQISIGGLSTGGTLGLYEAMTHPKINDTLYLFSAALDLIVQGSDMLGDLVEILLRSPLKDLFDTNKPLIGSRPLSYMHVDIDGVQELAKLILEVTSCLKRYSQEHPIPIRLFAAHSAVDMTADIKAVQALEAIAPPEKYRFFLIPECEQVVHSSVVLKDPVFAINANLDDPPVRKANPLFAEMMQAIADFQTPSA